LKSRCPFPTVVIIVLLLMTTEYFVINWWRNRNPAPAPLATITAPPLPSDHSLSPESASPLPDLSRLPYRNSDTTTSQGRRLVGLEFLSTQVGDNMYSARERLLDYLQNGNRDSLLEACRAFELLRRNENGWFAAMHEAYCLELLGKMSRRDELIRGKAVDRDTYAYYFGGGKQKVIRTLATIQFLDCRRNLRYLAQAVDTCVVVKGGVPENLEALVPEFMELTLWCPQGGEYVYRKITPAKPDDPPYKIICDQHRKHGLPVLEAPYNLFDHKIVDAELANHVYEQIAWMAAIPVEQREEIFRAIRVSAQFQPGEKVADVGSGIGFYTFLMARMVSPGGEVWAVDIKSSVLDYIKFVVGRHPGLAVRTVHSKPTDVCLPAGYFDKVILAHVYRMLAGPKREQWEYEKQVRPFVESIHKAMKPNGLLVIMDGEPGGVDSSLTVARQTVIREIEPLGFQWLKEKDLYHINGDTPDDYVVVFRRK